MKTFTLTGTEPGGTVGWQIFSTGKGHVDVSLRGDNQFYFYERLREGGMGMPAAQGARPCTDRTLTLTVENFGELNVNVVSSDILNGSGKPVGRSFRYICGDSLRVDITAWGIMSPTEPTTTLQRCFYTYLTLKDKYLFNYLSDPDVNRWYKAAQPSDLGRWYEQEQAKLSSELDEFKLALAFLLRYDSACQQGSGLRYRLSGDLLMAEGAKVWGEPKITVASCPFRNIRGVRLNETERAAVKKNLEMLSGMRILGDGSLQVGAAHGSMLSHLQLKATRPLGFENIGLYVASDSLTVEQKNISEAVSTAAGKNAQILIFPELSINKNTLAYLKSVLAASGGGLKLVVGGSYYHYDRNSTAYYNRAPIFVNRGGSWQEAAPYNKMIPFSMGYKKDVAEQYRIDTRQYPLERYKTLSEDIIMEDSVTILPFADCVVGVAICRDVLDLLDSHNPLHKYCDFVDVMLVISDNPGDSNMFVGTAECLARWHNCATVYTNAVSEAKSQVPTGDPYLEISFGLYPFKGKNVSSSTSVSGVISYLKSPFWIIKAAEAAEETPGEEQEDQILYSKGIKYEEIKEQDYCKVYALEYPKK